MIEPIIQLNTTFTAIAVATPLPPLKRKKTGKQCPAKAQNPVAAISSLLSVTAIATSIGIRPFRQSPTRVRKAAFLPAIRNTLVAPGFFEPSLRGSGKPDILLRMIADDNEPSR